MASTDMLLSGAKLSHYETFMEELDKISEKIDSKDYKTSSKLLNKHLKKHPGNIYLRIMNVLLLVRSRQYDDAIQGFIKISKEVSKVSQFVDFMFFLTYSSVYFELAYARPYLLDTNSNLYSTSEFLKAVPHPLSIIEAYTKKFNQSVSFLENWFFYSVANNSVFSANTPVIDNLRSVQRASMALYLDAKAKAAKNQNHNCTYTPRIMSFWVATSTTLLVSYINKKSTSSSSSYQSYVLPKKFIQEKDILFTLALRQLHLYIPYQSESEALVEVRLLFAAQKYKDALNVLLPYLNSDKVPSLDLLDITIKIINSHQPLLLLPEVITFAKKLLLKISDTNYNLWLVYLDASLAQGDLKQFDEFHSSFSSTDARPSRNYHLISVKRAYLTPAPEFSSATLLDYVDKYFNIFGSKRATFSDLKFLIDKIPQTQFRAWALNKLSTEYSDDPQLQYYNNVCNLYKLLFVYPNKESNETINDLESIPDIIPTLLNTYAKYKPKFVIESYVNGSESASQLEPPEEISPDDLILLVVAILLKSPFNTFPNKNHSCSKSSYEANSCNNLSNKISKTKFSLDVLISCILLESICEDHPLQFYSRIALIHIYVYMGQYYQALFHYSLLNIKNIQCDTLAHHLCTRLSSISPTHRTNDRLDIYSAEAKLDQNILALYDDPAFTLFEPPYNVRISMTGRSKVDTMRVAFYNGVYSQVADLREFTTRIETSITRLQMLIELNRFGITTGYSPATSHRFNENAANLRGDRFLEFGHEISDNRDDSFMWYGSLNLDPGPRPGREWVLVQEYRLALVNHLIDYPVIKDRDSESLGKHHDFSDIRKCREQAVGKMLEQIAGCITTARDQFTEVELWNATVMREIAFPMKNPDILRDYFVSFYETVIAPFFNFKGLGDISITEDGQMTDISDKGEANGGFYWSWKERHSCTIFLETLWSVLAIAKKQEEFAIKSKRNSSRRNKNDKKHNNLSKQENVAIDNSNVKDDGFKTITTSTLDSSKVNGEDSAAELVKHWKSLSSDLRSLIERSLKDFEKSKKGASFKGILQKSLSPWLEKMNVDKDFQTHLKGTSDKISEILDSMSAYDYRLVSNVYKSYYKL